MIVRFDAAGLKETTWREYILRFVFGGLITAAAGAIGTKWGPVIAGLFLAFPAIFPASATLVEQHELERKQRKGMHGEQRGIDAAADDAIGAMIGSAGLLAFATICWLLIPKYPAGLVLVGATSAWALVAVSIWTLRKSGWGRR
jgi:4-hydroxybenzoate polyprenyltransferase